MKVNDHTAAIAIFKLLGGPGSPHLSVYVWFRDVESRPYNLPTADHRVKV